MDSKKLEDMVKLCKKESLKFHIKGKENYRIWGDGETDDTDGLRAYFLGVDIDYAVNLPAVHKITKPLLIKNNAGVLKKLSFTHPTTVITVLDQKYLIPG